MPRFNANLTMLYTDLEFMDRFAAAARDGFKAVEFLFPYAYDKDRLAEALRTNGLQQVLHNLPAGNWEGGDRGIACNPDRVGEFQDGVGRAIEYAKALGCPQVNCLAGKAPPGVDQDKLRQTMVDNLKFAAVRLRDAGIKLLVEPVNDKDIPGFWVNRASRAIELIEAAGSDNIYLQYDFYHQQRMEGELIATYRRYKDRIAHIQIADNPGRNEPGTGEINYEFIFRELDNNGYPGWVGLEYVPKGKTSQGLGWANLRKLP